MARVLIAGASGAVGSRLLQQVKAAGHHTRTLSRSPARARALEADEVHAGDATDAEAVRAVCDGIDTVVSCLGANVSLRVRERRSYREVDLAANRNLLDAAVRSGVKRFVYLGVHTGPGYDHTAYVRAHEDFVGLLRQAPLASTVVRPTGIFTALDDLLAMARFGLGSVIGSGEARTNPVDASDVARACLSALEEGPADLSIGGPEILTRKELLGAAFAALGKKPRYVHLPPWLFRLQARLLKPVHPRLGELFEFVAAVSTSEGIAPQVGTRTLSEYFRARAGQAPER